MVVVALVVFACGESGDPGSPLASGQRMYTPPGESFSTESTEPVPPDSMGAKELVVEQPPGAVIPDESDAANLVGILGAERFDADGDRKVFVRRASDAIFTELVAAELVDGVWVEEVRVAGPAAPDRPAINPNGRSIAFVSGATGITSVWVMPFDGTDEPLQVTNAGLELLRRKPGQPPDGFVAPPIDDSLTFDGDDLEWNTADGVVRAAWR